MPIETLFSACSPLRALVCCFYIVSRFNLMFASVVDSSVFTLANFKENTLCVIALLIFNIFHKLRHSFTEYRGLLEFAWMCFADLEQYLNAAHVDKDFLITLVQNSLYAARQHEDFDSQVNHDVLSKIDTLKSKLLTYHQQQTSSSSSIMSSLLSNKQAKGSRGQRATSSSSNLSPLQQHQQMFKSTSNQVQSMLQLQQQQQQQLHQMQANESAKNLSAMGPNATTNRGRSLANECSSSSQPKATKREIRLNKLEEC